MINISNESLLQKLEEVSREKPNRVLILKGFLINKNGTKEFLEILIFKGFSSCTTHSTDSNIDRSTLPKKGVIETADLLVGPMDLKDKQILKSSENPIKFMNYNYWD